MSSFAASWGTETKRFSRRWLDKNRKLNGKNVSESTTAIAWFVGRAVGWTVDWLLGTQIGFANKPRSTNGVQAISTLLMSVGTLTVALLAYILGEKQAGSRLIWAYIGLSAIPLIAMFLITQLTERDEFRKLVYSFDRGAIMFARWCVVMSLITVTIVSTLFYAGSLPGQEPSVYRLFASDAKVSHFENSHQDRGIKKGDEKLEVTVPLRRDDLIRMQSPDPLYLEIELGPDVRRTWQIAEVDGAENNEVSKTQPELLDEPLTEEEDGRRLASRKSGKYAVLWPYGNKKGADYTLTLYLHHQPGSPVDAKALKRLILEREDAAFSVTAFYR